jgi:hypothetical protein
MPADYLTRNVVEAIRISDEDLADKQKHWSFVCYNKKHFEKWTNPTNLQLKISETSIKTCNNLFYLKWHFMDKNNQIQRK